MIKIPTGKYLLLDEYRKQLGVENNSVIIRAIKDGRLKGAIQITNRVYIIPKNAVLMSKKKYTGKSIGKTAWIKGNQAQEEEAKLWEERQQKLRALWKNDKKEEE